MATPITPKMMFSFMFCIHILFFAVFACLLNLWHHKPRSRGDDSM